MEYIKQKDPFMRPTTGAWDPILDLSIGKQAITVGGPW